MQIAIDLNQYLTVSVKQNDSRICFWNMTKIYKNKFLIVRMNIKNNNYKKKNKIEK